MALRKYCGTDVNKEGAEDMVKLQQQAIQAGAAGHYNADDLAELVSSVTPAYYMKLPPTFNIFLYLDSQHSDDSEFLTGFAVVGTRTGRLTALYVHPDHWRRGVGRALMKSAGPFIKNVESTLNAVPFFEACGMRCTGEGFLDFNSRKVRCAKLEFPNTLQGSTKRPEEVEGLDGRAVRRKLS